ncbi:MAG: undecaprenyl-diphosphate phosphatase [Planctomycetes bacterium]|nr:undecaprenyl-diphosphate phosphatase [Planctomycetota bacterium]
MPPEVPDPEQLSYLSAIILGLIQGLTEFLPVSSSGHLALANHLEICDPETHTAAFDILLHLATLLVVLKVFWRDIRRVLEADRIVIQYLAIGTVPALLVGFFLRDLILINLRESPMAVSIALLVTAGFLFACDRRRDGHKHMARLGNGGSFSVGLAQALALVPGVSRSGMSITAGVMAGLSREEAFRFSFLLLIPALLAATAHSLVFDSGSWDSLPLGPSIAGVVAAIVSGYIALMILRKMVVQKRLIIFAIYCTLLGLSGLVYFGLIK